MIFWVLFWYIQCTVASGYEVDPGALAVQMSNGEIVPLDHPDAETGKVIGMSSWDNGSSTGHLFIQQGTAYLINDSGSPVRWTEVINDSAVCITPAGHATRTCSGNNVPIAGKAQGLMSMEFPGSGDYVTIRFQR